MPSHSRLVSAFNPKERDRGREQREEDRGTTSGGPYTKINPSLGGTLSYTDSTLQSSTTYYYVTTAVDSSGNESAYSNEVPASIP